MALRLPLRTAAPRARRPRPPPPGTGRRPAGVVDTRPSPPPPSPWSYAQIDRGAGVNPRRLDLLRAQRVGRPGDPLGPLVGGVPAPRIVVPVGLVNLHLADPAPGRIVHHHHTHHRLSLP